MKTWSLVFEKALIWYESGVLQLFARVGGPESLISMGDFNKFRLIVLPVKVARWACWAIFIGNVGLAFFLPF